LSIRRFRLHSAFGNLCLVLPSRSGYRETPVYEALHCPIFYASDDGAGHRLLG
jgi:hypothetical protein